MAGTQIAYSSIPKVYWDILILFWNKVLKSPPGPLSTSESGIQDQVKSLFLPG